MEGWYIDLTTMSEACNGCAVPCTAKKVKSSKRKMYDISKCPCKECLVKVTCRSQCGDRQAYAWGTFTWQAYEANG